MVVGDGGGDSGKHWGLLLHLRAVRQRGLRVYVSPAAGSQLVPEGNTALLCYSPPRSCK